MPKTGDSSALKDPLIAAEEGGAGSSASIVTRSKEPTQTFEFSEDGLSDEQVTELRKEWGANALPENKKSKLMLLLLAFTSPMALLIWVGIIVELVVGLLKLSEGLKGAEGPTEDLVDFGVLLLLQFMNAFVGWHEECKAGDAVDALKKSLAPKANVKRNGRWVVVPGVDLVPGDLVVLALGGAVPADCRLLAGKEIGVDQAALTGESLPVKMREGDVAKMGSCVATGEIEAVVVATGANTFFGKTAALLNSVDESSNLDKVLLQILFAICAIGLPCIGAICVVLGVRGNGAEVVIIEAVVLLVAVVPIANQVVCTSTLALGGRTLASHKAIVTRLSSIEELAGMAMLCSDKTGTLTLNKMVMQQIVTEDGAAHAWPEECNASAAATAVLQAAALATKWRETPKDALDTLVLGAAQSMLPQLDAFTQLDYSPFDPSIKRTTATLRDASGNVFDVTKGAPPVVLRMAHNYSVIRENIEQAIDDYAERGVRCIAIARTDSQKRWCFMGLITFLDPPRPDTKQTIELANALGVGVKMITGDQLKIAKETCRVLGMGTAVYGTADLPEGAQHDSPAADLVEIADGFAGVFPEHKFDIVDILRKRGWTCGMTGDGVNDAPALKKADVGIAVQGATDAACAAADIVLTEPGLSTIIVAIRLSRKIFQRMKNYLTYRVASSLMLALFFLVSASAFNPIAYLGCEKLPDGSLDPAVDGKICQIETESGSQIVVDMHGVAIPSFFLLNILQLVFMIMFNDICMITVAWDNVQDSRLPKKWDMMRLYALASVMCVVVTILQLLYLGMGFAAMKPSDDQPGRLNLFWWFGIHEPLQFSEMETMMYISLSWAGFLTLLSARNEGPFWSSMPGMHLSAAFVFSVCATTLIGALLKEDDISFWACPIEYIGVTLLYNLCAFVVLDFFKVVANKVLDRIQAADPQRVKESKFNLWSQNRATLASEPLAGSRAGSRMTGGSRASRATHQSIGNGDALLRSASGLSSMSTKARQSEVDRLHGAVAQLAGLVGSLAGNNAQVKSAVSEIIASVGGI